jgi:hypothetical protein
MNRAIDKRQRRFLGASVWFLHVPGLLSLPIVAWRHVRTIVTFGAVLLIPTFCYVETIAAQFNGKELELPQVVSGGAYLLGSPNNGGPVIVRIAFQLQDVNEIDDDAETFQFTGVLNPTKKIVVNTDVTCFTKFCRD